VRRNQLKLGYWQLFAILLALIPLWRWSTGSAPCADQEFEADAAFMEDARHAVLPGSSYTVRAADRRKEQRLFDLSLGMTPGRKAVATRYDARGRSLPNDARYVVAYGNHTGGEKLQFVVRFERGTVYERGSR
jgi:hypothetical protein